MFEKLFTNDGFCGIIYTKAKNAFENFKFPILSHIVGGSLKRSRKSLSGDDFLTYNFILGWYRGRNNK